MNFNEYADHEMLALEVAKLLAGELRQALGQKARVTFGVPGGTTPAPVFDALCGVDLDWGRVDVLLSDERWVAQTSPRSNTALLRAHLLQDRAGAAQLVAMHADTPRPEDALPDLALKLGPHLPIDVLVLGMGTDMHVASLIPTADRLADALKPDAPLLMAMRLPGEPEARVSLSAPVLQGAGRTHLLITGAAKRAALERAGEIDDPLLAPVCVVLDQAEVHWAP